MSKTQTSLVLPRVECYDYVIYSLVPGPAHEDSYRSIHGKLKSAHDDKRRWRNLVVMTVISQIPAHNNGYIQ